MLDQVADGVWVRQSERVWSNAVVVRGHGGSILVGPGIDGSGLDQFADEVDRLGIPIVAGFSAHPHWDHLLWHPRFGDRPRYATPAGAQAGAARERAQKVAAESASGHPARADRALTPLPAGGGPVPGEIIEHQAHAVGHAAVLLADRGVLLAGDMLSDVLIPSSTAAAPIRWAPTRRHSTGWVRLPGTSVSWSPARSGRTWSRPDPHPDERRRQRVMVATR